MSVPRLPTACHRCGGRLETGFVLDNLNGMYTTSTWVEGEPVKSIWLGLKLRGRRRVKVTSLRCRSCGLLEHYAPE